MRGSRAFDQPALMQHQDPVHPPRQLEIVGGDQSSQPLGPGDRDQGVKHPARGLGIQIACGFVRQQKARLVGQGAGDGDPLLFAARQLTRAMGQPLSQAQPLPRAPLASFRWSREKTRELRELAPSAYRTRDEDLLLTALALVLGRRVGTADVWVELDGSARDNAAAFGAASAGLDLGRSVGPFTSTFPVHLAPAQGGGELGDAIKAIKEQLRSVPAAGVAHGLAHSVPEARALASFRYHTPFAGRAVGPCFESVTSLAESGLDPQPAKAQPASVQSGTAPLAIAAEIRGGELVVSLFADAAAPAPEHLLEELEAELDRLLEHCVRGGVFTLTPSDVVGTDLAQEDIDAVLQGLALDIG